jgi:hypothetical protein
MGSFSMSTNRTNNVFEVMVEGTFSQEDAMAFITEYNQEVASFQPEDYVIQLDCTKLNVSSPDVLPMLEQCYRMYKETGFQKVTFTISKNPVLKMQLGRVARNTGLANYEIAEV